MVSEYARERYNIYPLNGNVTPHQAIKGKAIAKSETDVFTGRRCIWCKHYTKSLKSKTCTECLETDELDNFIRTD